jgi:hypothetical protein
LIFSKEIKFFKPRGDEFFRRNKAERSEELSVSTIYFPATQRARIPEICREIPPGGRGDAMLLRGKHE